jgi:hypothetical protein
MTYIEVWEQLILEQFDVIEKKIWAPSVVQPTDF